MKVRLVNPTTKDIRSATTGFDWPAFFSMFIFGIPHFLRGMWVPGCIGVGFFLLTMLLTGAAPTPELSKTFLWIMVAARVAFGLFFGIKGGEQYAKALLARGYQLEDPEGEIAQQARMKWVIAA